MAFPVSVTDLITASLRTLNIVGTGRNPTATEMSDGCYVLNEVLDSWNIDGTTIYARQFLTFPTNSSYQTNANGIFYTLGPNGSGANWTMPVGQSRTANIEFVSFQLPTVPVVNKPCRLLTASEWSAIRATQVQSTIPNYIYIDEQYPICNVYVWPIPVGGSTLTFDFWQQLPTQLTLTSQLNLPPGYARALRYELAMAYAAEFGKQAPPDVAAAYSAIRQNILVNNIQSNRLVYDVPFGPGIYDVLSDQLY